MRDIGIEVKKPENVCKDERCPFHGTLPIRGQILTGKVVKIYGKTAVIERELIKYVPKYERYMRKRSKLHAHNPDCIRAKPGDLVRIGECRPISKTKSFVILEVI
ncbi:MAG: 30S ribosomal protein S17 [Archaeoglobaceae archaeon]|nr:30S ribosomal protein S17 [Archaeoglobaceae archaeon]MDW7989629.1 30S ribosomal protein S17 [Archaeoglobaceae archaeon]